MLKSGCIFLHLAVVCVCVWGFYCLNLNEESAVAYELKPLVSNCTEDCDIKEDLNAEKINPCFKKCLLVKIGLINENGKYNRSEVKRQINNYTDNENEAQMILEAVDECFKGKSGDQTEEEQINAVYECFMNF